ncbi:MAG: restriction endonuclease, partial [Gammaproteobacteria bacterium]|nr:restriction endonuclease [Gammaproteobacteria bacterium]
SLGSPVAAADEESEDVVVQLKDETIAQSQELIKDKVVSLAPDEMEELVAAIFRAMGYKSKVSPKGPDRGVDVVASPDGLGLTQPRIKAEVKHRDGSMGAPAIRGFIGALREGDSGLFISTGGFSREARYEAERSTFPLTLVDLDDLADLIVGHYENFDLEGRALVTLVRIYWPVD